MIRKLIFAFVFGIGGFGATAEPVTIAALGDSLTRGYGLEQTEGFVPQLQSWLNEQGADVALINAGVSGDTTAGGAARVAWTLTPEVDAMIVTLGGNDLLRGIPAKTARANLETILRAASAANVKVLLIGLSAPGNYGADYKAEFDAIYPELATRYETLFEENFLAGVTAEDGRANAAMMQSDGIHPNARGVGLIVERLGPRVLELIRQIDVAS